MSHSLTEKSAPPDTRNSLSYRGYSSCGYRRQVTRPLCPNSTLCTGHPEEMKIQTHEVTLTFSMFTPSGHSLNQMTLLLLPFNNFCFRAKMLRNVSSFIFSATDGIQNSTCIFVFIPYSLCFWLNYNNHKGK